MAVEQYPVTLYSSGIAVSAGESSYAEILEAGGNNSITATSGGIVAETSMGEGALLVAGPGAIVSGININDEGAVFSGTEVFCSGAEKWYGPVACATEGSIVLVGGTFSNNSAFASGGYLGQGGALEGYWGDIRVSGGVYSANMATGGGGAILALGGETVITGAEFTENSATYGGAVEISWEEAVATISGAVFSKNSAEYGGAVEIHQGASVFISGAAFTGNTASSGGAVMVDAYAAEKSYLTVVGATFSKNIAEEGGAILNDGVLTVAGGSFTANTAEDGKGGALYNTGSATVSGAKFAANTAIYGGAVWQGNKKLTLTAANVSGNTAIYGGALYANGSGATVISGGSFVGNRAHYDEDYDLGGMGGAIYATAAATVTVTDTFFGNNVAEVNPDNEWDGGCGGAVINYGSMTVTGGSFTKNSAYYGGGLYNQAGDGMPMTVSGANFASNFATYGGGAICNCWGELVISGGSFTSNTVQIRDGGAVANWSDATITDAVFTENAAVKGGALAHTGTTITVDGAVFGENSAEEGGAFWNMNEWGDSVATLVNCSYTGNTAEQGGAIWNGEELTVSGGEFSNNAALDGKGGALYNSGAAVVSGANFVENEAVYGGAIWHGGETLEVADAYIADNTAIYGGALYANGSGATVISAASFEGNGAIYDYDYELGGMGGAIYVTAAATVTVTDAIFENNIAEVNPDNEWDGGCGGAVINYGSMTVTSGAFVANSAYYGGGLYNQAGAGVPMTVADTNFTANSATYGGGAICNCWGELVVSGGEFSGNTVQIRDGGAVANWSDATITDAIFTKNTAVKGGALAHTGTTITVDGAVFNGNGAEEGGAFWNMNEWGDSVATLVNCTFAGNTATQGGAIWNGETLYMDSCSFDTATDTIYNAGSITVVGETTFNAAVDNGETGVFTVLVGDAADSVLVNGWSFITGGSVGFDVSAGAEAGTYTVATGIGTWSGDIALGFDGEASGSAFTVENGVVTTDTIVIGNTTYTLANDEGAFELTIETVVTVAATLVGEFFGYGGVFQLMSDGSGAVRTVEAVTELAGSVDLSKWELTVAGDFAGLGRDGLLWIEKETGYAYMQYDMTSFAEVTNKTNCLGVVGEGYTVKASGDFSGSSIDGVLMQGPEFGDPSESINYGLPVWARDETGATYNGWLGALVNTWEPGDELKGDLSDPASINANNYKYDIVGVGDFNGDGRDDVMIQNSMPKVVNQGGTDYTITGSGDVFVLLTGSDISGYQDVSVAYAGCATDGWSVVGFGDFDSDGVTDALLSDGTGVAGWKMADGQRGGDFWFGSLADGYEIAGVGDVNADGTADIVLRCAADDTFAAWTVQNGVVTGALALK